MNIKTAKVILYSNIKSLFYFINKLFIKIILYLFIQIIPLGILIFISWLLILNYCLKQFHLQSHIQ